MRKWIVGLLPLVLAGLSFAAAPVATTDGGGFLFVTFKGEATPKTEQIYFGASTDGMHWEALNKGAPVLVSEIGEKGARDPYILRKHDGSGFVIVATDLSINRNRDWTRATHAGSKSLLIWESPDLVKWSEPRLVKVAPEDAGCTWAPEAMWDDQKQEYLLYWASTSAKDTPPFSKQRILGVWTKDFKEVSAPFVYIEKPGPVIDTDMVRGEDGQLYRFTKDEKVKSIVMETSGAIEGPWRAVPNFSLAGMKGYEGPACFELSPGSEGKAATWCLLLDNYQKGKGYKAFTTNNLAAGQFVASSEMQFPFMFRHGAVLKLSAEEYGRVRAAYGGAGEARQP